MPKRVALSPLPAGPARAPRDLGNELLPWFQEVARPLPWRTERTPYRVWVSEIMLQQTRVATVIPYFERFTSQFPTVAELAAADIDEVLKLWSGLGYYRRSRSLHQGAQYVVSVCGGEFPRTVDGLRAIPGVGPYTAGAIASQAFGVPVAAVDGNVIRVISRVFALEQDMRKAAGQNLVWALASQEVKLQVPGTFNEALMELGATVCTPTSPQCLICPIRKKCDGHKGPDPTAHPVLSKKKPPKPRAVSAFVLRNRDGDVCLAQRVNTNLFQGLWEPPTYGTEKAVPARWKKLAKELKPRAQVVHILSHRRLEVDVFDVDVGAVELPKSYGKTYEGARFVSQSNLSNFALSTLARRVLGAAGITTA